MRVRWYPERIGSVLSVINPARFVQRGHGGALRGVSSSGKNEGCKEIVSVVSIVDDG